MSLSADYRSTIIKVSVTFGFTGFECAPEEIGRALRIKPDGVALKGSKRILPNGRETNNPVSFWSIVSRSKSKDVNVHIRGLLARIAGRQSKLRPEFGRPDVSVTWFGNYLYAGSGPFYEADVIEQIASWGAMLWHDIYQVDQEENPPSGKLGLKSV
jgi:hypothetical protein